MATITPSFLRQGNCGASGDVYTCIRQGNSGASTTADIGGSGSGSSYANAVLVRFDSLPSGIAAATLTVTYQSSGSSYWNAEQTLTVTGCANFNNNTNGTALPAMYDADAGKSAGGVADAVIDVTKALKSALLNGSKCLYISANHADNRKRVKSIKLEYTPIDVIFNGNTVQTIVINGTTVTSLKVNGTTVF